MICELENILKIGTQLEFLKDELEDINMEEEMARDNTPESLQNSERYEESERISECVENAIDYVNDAISMLESAAGELAEI